MKKCFTVLTVMLLLIALLTGCGGSAYKGSGEMSGEMYDSMVAPTEAVNVASSAAVPGLPANRKLIRTGSMRAETKDLDALMAQLDAQIAQLDGYVESRQIRNNTAVYSASMTVRIPAEKMDAFTKGVSESANVTYFNENVEDITLTYVDTESRIRALQTEQTRLLELLEKAESLQDVLEIEDRLTSVRAELESYSARLRVYDNQIDYAKLELELRQTEVLTVVQEQTVWQRIGNGFSQNMKAVITFAENAFVLLVSGLPFLLPLAVIGVVALVIALVSMRAQKKHKKRQDPPQTP